MLLIILFEIRLTFEIRRQRQGVTVPRADDRSYMMGSIRGWNRSLMAYIMGGC